MRLAAVVASSLLLWSLSVYAGESEKAVGRTISYRTAVKVLERDAEDNPIRGTAERVGVTLHEMGPEKGLPKPRARHQRRSRRCSEQSLGILAHIGRAAAAACRLRCLFGARNPRPGGPIHLSL